MDLETSVHNNFGDFIFGHGRWAALKWIESELGSTGSQFSGKVAKAQRTSATAHRTENRQRLVSRRSRPALDNALPTARESPKGLDKSRQASRPIASRNFRV
jgi:hypothetical protein